MIVTVLKTAWDRTVGDLMVFVFVGLIRGYQMTISPMLGQVCRYYPSCSHYGLGAIRQHRAGKGIVLTAWRIMRCNPWSKGGSDPVPPRGSWRNAPTEVIERSIKTAGVVPDHGIGLEA